jgi:signal recognition particle receptor subunit beta
MAFIDHAKRTLNCKLVYYGSGLAGRTTNLQYIHHTAPPERTGKMISLATEDERTLFFDFAPEWLPPIHGLEVRLHLYTIPGARFYEDHRTLVLRGVDGVVFVADSQDFRANANIFELEDLRGRLATYGRDLRDVPLVMQYNKRDLPDAMAVAELDALLATVECPRIEAVAINGRGVLDALVAVAQPMLVRLERSLDFPDFPD